MLNNVVGFVKDHPVAIIVGIIVFLFLWLIVGAGIVASESWTIEDEN